MSGLLLVDHGRINAGDIQKLYDRALANLDHATACLALAALEYGYGHQTWDACERILDEGVEP